MNSAELRDRTKNFALRIIRLVNALPTDRVSTVLGRQLLRSGTSIGSNYREALRASSRKHFISICETVQREADETAYWLELIAESEVVNPERLQPLAAECNELIAIFTATIKSTKQKTLSEKELHKKTN